MKDSSKLSLKNNTSCVIPYLFTLVSHSRKSPLSLLSFSWKMSQDIKVLLRSALQHSWWYLARERQYPENSSQTEGRVLSVLRPWPCAYLGKKQQAWGAGISEEGIDFRNWFQPRCIFLICTLPEEQRTLYYQYHQFLLLWPKLGLSGNGSFHFAIIKRNAIHLPHRVPTLYQALCTGAGDIRVDANIPVGLCFPPRNSDSPGHRWSWSP